MTAPFKFAGGSILVTGGTGFIGSALVRALVRAGCRVRTLDNDSRGRRSRLADCAGAVETIVGDIRDQETVMRAVRGVDAVLHLAYINGTEFFYQKPELVLEVAVKGMMNVLDACTAADVRQLFLASSSEVYQQAPKIPTDETAPLVVPDVLNPRYSYGGGKIISELLAINYGRTRFDRVIIFRPHNVYGPDMGREHVIPQFALRLKQACAGTTGSVDFAIQGSGQETRAFIFIDDFVDGTLRVIERGQHLGIYHIGTQEEVTIAEVARHVAACFHREIHLVPGALQPGGTPRRCPDIARLRALGFAPKTSLRDGIAATVAWYQQND
jgi:nucleoside-diphosphate-sugar epimerase